MDLDSLLSHSGSRPDPAEIVRRFVPPTRFAPKRFLNYHPRHPSQAAAVGRLESVGSGLNGRSERPMLSRLFRPMRRPAGHGLYVDGGFGVGKTHLLAALWNAAPAPKAYLAFDELVFFIGLFGRAAPGHFAGHRLIAIDEWELDDPGNLTMALAFLRPVLAAGAFVAVTSNTLPLELGAGRFSQKDFRSEIDELAAAFEVVRIEGDDYRHRHYVSNPGREIFWPDDMLDEAVRRGGEGVLAGSFDELLSALATVHPIRYREVAGRTKGVFVRGVSQISALPDALRWVHFIDSIYDAAVPFAASGAIPLGQLFSADTATGPFGKKLSRCLSRMEELLAGAQVTPD